MSGFDAGIYLKQAGLRLTRPRQEIATILFADGARRHITAEQLATLLAQREAPAVLATVYNTLHAFVEAGLLREVHGTPAGVTVFDTHTAPHHHFYDCETGELTDIEAPALRLSALPTPPEGKRIAGYDVVIRLG